MIKVKKRESLWSMFKKEIGIKKGLKFCKDCKYYERYSICLYSPSIGDIADCWNNDTAKYTTRNRKNNCKYFVIK